MLIDDAFLKYFRFICDIICYQGGESPQGKSPDEFDLLEEYFTGDKEKVRRNIDALEEYFDCWCRMDGCADPADFLASHMSYGHMEGKIVIDTRYKIDIFEDCLHSYANKSERLRQFPLNRTVLLYAVTCFLRNREEISDDGFQRRLRCINNLIQNSEDEVSDRIDRNRIPAVLWQTEAIMLGGAVDDTVENSFNAIQIAEEKEKKAFLEEHPEQAERLFALEDHPNLKGQISIVGLDHVDYEGRFAFLFRCDWDRIDCALMATGDYGQQERNRWRWQYGSWWMQTAWDELFHRSANMGFEKTKAVLAELLSKAAAFSNGSLKQIADGFLADCEARSTYPWRYYYVKYQSFRPGRYGKYSNDHFEDQPYMFSVMWTRSQGSSNAYMPYLKEADETHLDKDSMGRRLVYGDRHIVCENAAYLIRDNKTEGVLERIEIRQDEAGVDMEDRIVLLKKYLAGKR